MDLCEKIQQLRKDKGWTQEQLAEKLFVSRTAISKWESGKGYPNIDSLKSLSKLFAVTIDDLLSSEELISLATNENRVNLSRVFSLIYGTLDLLTLAFLFLPLYSRQDSDFVRTVSLLENPDANALTWSIYIAIPIVIAVFGIVQIVASRYQNGRRRGINQLASMVLQAVGILAYIATRQPYAASLLFLLFIIKVVLLLYGNRMY